VRNDNEYRIFIDGAQVGSPKNGGAGLEFRPVGRYFVIGAKQQWKLNALATLDGFVDQIRVYDDNICATTVSALYNQDADYDGLFDRTEGPSRKWNDLDKDDLLDDGEAFYILNPFRWDPDNADHDHDGVTSLDEQNVHQTFADNPDSDGDLLPDGWELNNLLDPLNTVGEDGAQGDPDGDMVVNLIEYNFQSSAQTGFTDGDAFSDHDEIYGPDGDIETPDGTNPNYSPENGDADLPSEDRYALRLGVGDQSWSQSEDYLIKVRRIDPISGLEESQPVLIHRSGGFGQYDEMVYNMFDRFSAYTFQIVWAGTNNVDEKPDFDYTFKVESFSGSGDAIIVDSLESLGGRYDRNEELDLLGQVESENVQNFDKDIQKMRVGVVKRFMDLWVDTDMDGKVEIGATSAMGGSDDDDRVEEEERSVIIDVNNNNSDGRAVVDNEDNILDTELDRKEHTSRVLASQQNNGGHRFGSVRVTAVETKEFNKAKSDNLKLRFFTSNPGGNDVIRLFSYESFSQDPDEPEMLIGPGQETKEIDFSKILTSPTSSGAAFGQIRKRNFFVEGVTYGVADLEAEVVDPTGAGGGEALLNTDKVRIAVNVDRVAQNSANIQSKDARHTRGQFPHHGGFRQTVDTSTPIRAIKGRLTCRPPSFLDGGGWNTQHTWMRDWVLRQNLMGDNESSGSSFWIGLNTLGVDPGEQGGAVQDSSLRWIQFGVRWVQIPDNKFGFASAAYLEVGDSLFPQAKTLKHAFPGQAISGIGGGSSETNQSSLQGWEAEPLVLDFVLFKSNYSGP